MVFMEQQYGVFTYKFQFDCFYLTSKRSHFPVIKLRCFVIDDVPQN